MPVDFKSFLKNPDNKMQLFNVIKDVLSNNESSSHLEDQSYILIVDGEAYKFTSDGTTVNKSEVKELSSNQEEIDNQSYCVLDVCTIQGLQEGDCQNTRQIKEI